jgi:integrase/recombinase XerD
MFILVCIHYTRECRIAVGDVERLLNSRDRGDTVGIRDYAILMLVARLGLRSAEVARLERGDIDWRAGQITLRCKARRQEGMPLPTQLLFLVG